MHIHLSDDQGWRFKSNPDPVTEIGAQTEVGGVREDLCQEDYGVEYASDRFITIVPEIDLPGAYNAALLCRT